MDATKEGLKGVNHRSGHTKRFRKKEHEVEGARYLAWDEME